MAASSFSYQRPVCSSRLSVTSLELIVKNSDYHVGSGMLLKKKKKERIKQSLIHCLQCSCIKSSLGSLLASKKLQTVLPMTEFAAHFNLCHG